MPVRNRAGSSPIRNSDRGDEKGDVLSTHLPMGKYRRSSLGTVQVTNTRSRANTTTSSELSDPDFDRVGLPKRQIHFSSEHQFIEPDSQNDEQNTENSEVTTGEINEQDDDFAPESVDSALSSDFGATGGSISLLAHVGMDHPLDSSLATTQKLANPSSTHGVSPKKPKAPAPTLQDLPPPRPISTVQPVSLLSKQLNARKTVPLNPIERFAPLYAPGSNAVLNIKIYTPFSDDPDTPFDMPIHRESKEGDAPAPVTVAEAIGLGLWRYLEEGRKPPIERGRLTVNRWTLRMVEDGEVDYDFPALGRNLPFADFTSNNNRAGAMRGRSRGKPYDEFALVEADQADFEENERLYPNFSIQEDESLEPAQAPVASRAIITTTVAPLNRLNPILNQPFSSALNRTLIPADKPAIPTSHATPRLGVSKTIKVRFVNLEGSAQVMTVNTATDSYIAEILDSVCKRWALDKGNYLLKVMGFNTVAPLDRTVEALGTVTDLDLVRRRFGAASSLTGSPGSASPNAPLLIEGPPSATAKKGKKGQQMLHPLSQKQDLVGGYYRRFFVYRKQSMSFTVSNSRVLVLDNDYMHIMPGESAKGVFENTSKTRSISFNDIVSCKVSRRHPKSFRVMVLRNNEANEQKRYDFEARNQAEAIEIVDELKKLMARYRL